MSTLSARLGLKKHTTADRFHIQDYADNWTILDQYPGAFICTSSSHPTTWGAAQVGQRIVETDTSLVWQWTGTGFIRQAPAGLLNRVSRTADISTTSLSLIVAISNTVTIPAGSRSVQIMAEGPGVYNTAGVTQVALFRGATQLQTFQVNATGGSATTPPRHLSFVTVDVAPTPGPETYSIQFSSVVGVGGTSTLQGSTNAPLALTVIEV